MSVEELTSAGQKPRIILDNLHDEYPETSYDKLFEIMSELCEITVLKKNRYI